MDRLFATQGDVGNLHLEIQHVDGKWQWCVFDTTLNTKLTGGRANSFSEAQAETEAAAGGTPEWRTVEKEAEKKPAV